METKIPTAFALMTGAVGMERGIGYIPEKCYFLNSRITSPIQSTMLVPMMMIIQSVK